MRWSKSSSKREVYSDTGFPQKNKKNPKQTNSSPERIRKRGTKTKVNRRKETIKIREEINKIEFKKLKRSIKPRAGFFKR